MLRSWDQAGNNFWINWKVFGGDVTSNLRHPTVLEDTPCSRWELGTLAPSDSQTEGTQRNATRAIRIGRNARLLCRARQFRVRGRPSVSVRASEMAPRLRGPSSVCHQPRRIHNGASSKGSLLGRGEQWAVSTDRRLHFSFPNSGIRGGDNQWKCSICFMSTAEHTTEDNHFFLSSPPHPSILPIMLAHFHPLVVSAGDLSGRVQTASRRRNAFAFACFTSLLRKFASCSSNNWGIIIKNTPKKKKSDKNVQNFLNLFYIYLKPEPAGSHRSLIASLSVKRQTMTDVALAFVFPANSLFSQIARLKSVGSYRFQAMSRHIQSHKTPCALCHSSFCQRDPRSRGS